MATQHWILLAVGIVMVIGQGWASWKMLKGPTHYISGVVNPKQPKGRADAWHRTAGYPDGVEAIKVRRS